MDLGTAPAWGALVLSAAALVVSLKARGDGKRSADAAWETLADMRRAAEPKVEWLLEAAGEYSYRLRNIGTLDAAGVTLLKQGLPFTVMMLRRPNGVTLRPGQAAVFHVAGMIGGPLPTELWVMWDGQPEPVAVPVPTGKKR